MNLCKGYRVLAVLCFLIALSMVCVAWICPIHPLRVLFVLMAGFMIYLGSESWISSNEPV